MSQADVRDVEVNATDDHAASKDSLKSDALLQGNDKNSKGKQKTADNDAASDLGAPADDADVENDSEAETLIQSPEKKRSIAESASTGYHAKNTDASDAGSVVLTNPSDKENGNRKRKRPQRDADHVPRSPNSSRHSSPLSSPVANGSDHASNTSPQARRREKRQNRQNSPDSDDKITSPKKRRRRPSEIAVPNSSHKRSKQNSIDITERRETRSATYPRPSDDERSVSPEAPTRREHRRGASTQLTPHEFKRRGRPPNIQTRRNPPSDENSDSSDDSDANSRSRPPLNKLTSQDHDTMSPAKVGPRKWKDKNGRTYLARACANDDLDLARQKLLERPGDLNMPDNAGNTPLQIASLEGFESIVEFLLKAGADVNMRNLDKDTPLIDAVENGHVEVIRLLLWHGANPRMGNAKGDEPYELVHPDDESKDLIRSLLTDARDKSSRKVPALDQEQIGRDGASSRAASAASPRDSPPVGTRSPPTAFGSRRRTGRSESTRNDLLWQANTQENLAKLASKGDVQGVVSILSILEKADTEALIAAAKAGHEEVLQMLIAMGKPNADPHPIPGYKGGPMYATPMLAAIGRGHPDVVKLLANQPGFNAMRKHKDQTYYDLAKTRKGEKWSQEYDILKQAYDKVAAARGRKMNSPRKTRDVDKVKAKPARTSSSPVSIKRQSTSPTLTQKTLTRSDSMQKEKIKAGDLDKQKFGANNDTGDSAVAVVSDMDQSLAKEKKTHRTRRSQSDLPPLAGADSESAHKRRRLVTGKEHRRQNTTTSPDLEDSQTVAVKKEDKGNSMKRLRPSPTPEPPATEAREARSTNKKRRTVLESSPEQPRSASKASTTTSNDIIAPKVPTAEVGAEVTTDSKDTEEDKQVDMSDSTDVKRETSQQPEMSLGEPELEETASSGPPAAAIEDVEPSVETQCETVAAVTVDADAKQATEKHDDDAIREKQEKEAAAQADIAQKEAAAAAAAAAEEKRLAEEQAERQRLQQEQQEAERKAKEESERKAREAEEARLEAQRKAQEEEEAARKRAEEERQEALRRAAEQQRRLEELEAEKRRTEALPIVLCRTARMIESGDATVHSHEWLSKFVPLFTVRTQQLDPRCDPAVANETWIPNFQAAGLLSQKDLSLGTFAASSKRPATEHHRLCMWRVSRLKLSYDFSPEWITPVPKAIEIESVAQQKFFEMEELFWIRHSDFQDQASQVPHLQGFKIPSQPISLKTYDELFGFRKQKQNSGHGGRAGLTNGISVSTVLPSRENGVTH